MEIDNEIIDTQDTDDNKYQTSVYVFEKLNIIGFLAAGVAHEINNPLGFTCSNLSTAGKYLQELCSCIDEYRQFISQIGEPEVFTILPKHLKQKYDELCDPENVADADFLLQDFGDILEDSSQGMVRINDFVADLTHFAHPGQHGIRLVDINHCIQSTTNLIRHEIECKAKITMDYRELPLIRCFPRLLNVMFMRLLMDATESIESKGTLHVSTCFQRKTVVINIGHCDRNNSVENSDSSMELTTITHEDVVPSPGISAVLDAIQIHKGRLDISNRREAGIGFSITLPCNNGL